MPNGGHICCEYCVYNQNTPGKCDIFGIATGPFIICRMFRASEQSHQEARKQWPMLQELEPGVVYGIDNSVLVVPTPHPLYRMTEDKVETIIAPYKKLLQTLLTSPELSFDVNLRSSLPSEGGVYRIFESDSDWQTSVYIGTSNNLQNRIYRSHLMGIRQVSTFKRKLIEQGLFSDENAVKQYLKDKCKVQFITLSEKIDRLAFEHFAVAILKPRYND